MVATVLKEMMRQTRGIGATAPDAQLEMLLSPPLQVS